jgi:hypothetical protein
MSRIPHYLEYRLKDGYAVTAERFMVLIFVRNSILLGCVAAGRIRSIEKIQ